MKIDISIKRLLALYAHVTFFDCSEKPLIGRDIEAIIPENIRRDIMCGTQRMEWPIEFNTTWTDFVSYMNAISKIENNLVFGLEFDDEIEFRKVNSVLSMEVWDGEDLRPTKHRNYAPDFAQKALDTMEEILEGE